MSQAYKGRFCSRFYCDEVRERRCCADCWRRKARKCRRCCQNDPSRCGLLGEAPKRQKGKKHG